MSTNIFIFLLFCCHCVSLENFTLPPMPAFIYIHVLASSWRCQTTTTSTKCGIIPPHRTECFSCLSEKSVSSSGFPQLSSHTQRVHHHQGRIINKLLNAPMKYLSTRMDPILKKMYTHSTVASIKLFFISFNNKFTMRAKHMRWQLMALFDSTLYSSRKAPPEPPDLPLMVSTCDAKAVGKKRRRKSFTIFTINHARELHTNFVRSFIKKELGPSSSREYRFLIYNFLLLLLLIAATRNR